MSKYGRTIYLRQNVDGDWFIRISAHGNHEKIAAEESFSSPAAGMKAFIAEGRHQPFAAMVLIVDGSRPLTIRSPQLLPVAAGDAEADAAMLKTLQDAMRRPRAS